MITLRPAGTRGHNNLGWLDTWHTFSFAGYYDPAHTQFRALRVINEDWVEAGQGFGTHGHKEMEILTWVLEGDLAHQDSMGHQRGLQPGSAQAMSAGTGITHSEFNGSATERVHLLQIWILPDTPGLRPRYQEAAFSDPDLRNQLRLIASRDGAGGSVLIHQDVQVHVARLDEGVSVDHVFEPGRFGYLQVARGALELQGSAMTAGDGATLSGEDRITLKAVSDCEALLFDLA